MGDFNSSLNASDKSNGASSVTRAMSDFRDCVEEIEVEDVNHTGFRFTWIQKPLATGEDRGVLKKIDRVMSNSRFMELYACAHVIFLPYNVSDHSPALLQVPCDTKKNLLLLNSIIICQLQRSLVPLCRMFGRKMFRDIRCFLLYQK